MALLLRNAGAQGPWLHSRPPPGTPRGGGGLSPSGNLPQVLREKLRAWSLTCTTLILIPVTNSNTSKRSMDQVKALPGLGEGWGGRWRGLCVLSLRPDGGGGGAGAGLSCQLPKAHFSRTFRPQ